MPIPSRRALLRSIPPAVMLLPFASCGTNPQTDLDLIAAFAKAAGPELVKVIPASASIINAAVADITDADAALSGILTPTTPQTTTQKVIGGVLAIAPLALNFLPGTSALSLAAQAALALLPALAQAAGTTLPAAAAHAVTVPLGAPGPLTADQARAVLRGLRPA